jgi:hypothetical protein
MSCSNVNKTVFNFISSTSKGSKVEIPTFDFNLAEYNISVKFYNLTRDSGSSCNFMIPITLVNKTGPLKYDAGDIFVLGGADYFNSLQGLQYNFDTKKVGYIFYPADNWNPVKPSGVKGGMSGWLIAFIVILCVGAVGGAGYYFYNRRKLSQQMSSGSYDRF